MTELENKPRQGDPWETGERRRTPPTGFSGPAEGPSSPAGPTAGGGESYITGVLGALLGAIVGALPTLLTGLFGFVSGWLALLIPFGARRGYQLFRGPRKTGFAFALILGLSVLTAVGVCCWLIWPYSPLEAGLAFFLIPHRIQRHWRFQLPPEAEELHRAGGAGESEAAGQGRERRGERPAGHPLPLR